MLRAARSLCVLLAGVSVACGSDTPSEPSVRGPDRIAFIELVLAPPDGRLERYTGSQLAIINRDGTNYRTLAPDTLSVAAFDVAARATRVAYRFHNDDVIYVAAEDGAVLARVERQPAPHGARFTLSPDGSRVTFVSPSSSGSSRLWMQPMDGSQPLVLSTHDYGIGFGAWAPDGEWIAFSESDTLWRIRPDGTGRSRVAALHDVSDYAWSADSRQLAVVAAGGVWVVRADGTNLRQLTGAGQPVFSFIEPKWSPDGRRLLGRGDGADFGSLDVLVVRVSDGQMETRLSPSRSSGDWSPDGSRIVYVKAGSRQLVTVAVDGSDEEVIRTGPISKPRWLR